MDRIKESDWKLLRRLQPLAIDRFCQRVLSELQAKCSDTSATTHERYLQIYKLIHDQDNKMAKIFNEVRRSNALDRVLLLKTSGLITDEEFAEFSEELRDFIERLQNFYRTRNET